MPELLATGSVMTFEVPPVEITEHRAPDGTYFTTHSRRCQRCKHYATSVWGVPSSEHYCIRDGALHYVMWQ